MALKKTKGGRQRKVQSRAGSKEFEAWNWGTTLRTY